MINKRDAIKELKIMRKEQESLMPFCGGESSLMCTQRIEAIELAIAKLEE